jgi:hypothetical protein
MKHSQLKNVLGPIETLLRTLAIARRKRSRARWNILVTQQSKDQNPWSRCQLSTVHNMLDRFPPRGAQLDFLGVRKLECPLRSARISGNRKFVAVSLRKGTGIKSPVSLPRIIPVWASPQYCPTRMNRFHRYRTDTREPRLGYGFVRNVSLLMQSNVETNFPL